MNFDEFRGLRATACDCVRLRATACDCVRLRATACDCVLLRATACDCVRLRATAKLHVRLRATACDCVCTCNVVRRARMHPCVHDCMCTYAYMHKCMHVIYPLPLALIDALHVWFQPQPTTAAMNRILYQISRVPTDIQDQNGWH